MLKVHIARARDEFLAHLEPRLDAGIALGDRPGCDVLVDGVPERAHLEACPDLRAVVVPYAGVPRPTRELVAGFPGVTLHNVHHNAAPVAEMAVALFLAAAKELLPVDRVLRKGDWRPRYDRRDLLCAGKTALVLGHGAIGRRIGDTCRALGMHVVAVRRRGDHPLSALPDLLPRAHALFVCLPWTEATEGVLGAEELALLPDGAVLVNIARGPIVDEEALFRALESGRIAAGLDVWYAYPKEEDERAAKPPSRFPFGELDNVVMSPHRAGLVDGIEELRAEHVARLLNAAARGDPMDNRIDLEAGY